jgi:PAS domain S-box-containing protein
LSTNAANQVLRVLIVEDSENDAELLKIELQRAGYEPVCHRIDDGAAMSAALQRQGWDLVIADYVLPHFNGLDALALVKSMELDLPFIIVSGHITDSTAVAAMKAGAHDYVMKDNLARLGPAVQRELREAEMRRERRRTDQSLHVERVFREAIEHSVPAGIAAVDLEGRQTYVNRAFCAMVGWTAEELVGARPPFVYWPPSEIETITRALESVVREQASASGLELVFRTKSSELRNVLVQITPLRDAFGNITGWVTSTSDITERKRAESRLAGEHAITRLLAHAPSLEEAAPAILLRLIESLEVDLGTLWVPEPGGALLRAAVIEMRISSPSLQSLLQKSRGLKLEASDSLPGRVWEEQRPIWLSELNSPLDLHRSNLAAQAGLFSAVAFPIVSAGVFFGVLEFFATRRLESDPAQVNMMTAIGSEIGQFIQKRSAEEALRRAHDELEGRVQRRTAELKAANAHLQAAITERKRLENELLEITEKERRRIALDLHDDLGQKLAGVALMTKGLALKLAKRSAEEASEAAKINSLVQETMSHASDLAHDLATLDLATKDLPTALSDLAARAEELFRISCKFGATGEAPVLEPGMVTQLYKVAQEALTNAIKHGKAKRVTISLRTGPDKLVLEVQNNGLPFPDLQSRGAGMGLRIMNYRASLIGGTLEIRGLRNRGTIVTCSVSLENKK